jgi:GntR family transcriptional regulator, transcriptional repressor for pyruvate dehydrogenase complex
MDVLTLREQVSESLRKQIGDGELPVGAVLPSAAQLAERFQVSVPIVREALSDLRAQGLISSRQGAATTVLARQGRSGFRIQAVKVKDLAGLAELFEFRCDLEASAAAHAATRAKAADLRAIAAALKSLKANLLHPETGAAADVLLHTSIAKAAGRYHLQLISYMTEEFGEAIATARRNSAQWRGMPEKVHQEHEAIVEAIAARDPVAANLAMRRHLTGAARRLNLRK